MANPANDIQQCIQKCEQNSQQLRNMANQVTNMQVKTMLNEAAHHLDLCIEECKFSLQQVQSPAMA